MDPVAWNLLYVVSVSAMGTFIYAFAVTLGITLGFAVAISICGFAVMPVNLLFDRWEDWWRPRRRR